MLQVLLICSLPIVGMLVFGMIVNLVIKRIEKLENVTK